MGSQEEVLKTKTLGPPLPKVVRVEHCALKRAVREGLHVGVFVKATIAATTTATTAAASCTSTAACQRDWIDKAILCTL